MRNVVMVVVVVLIMVVAVVGMRTVVPDVQHLVPVPSSLQYVP